MVIAAGGCGPGPGIGTVRGIEGVDAAADHVLGLLAQHLADGAQFAGVAIALAQQARGREVPAIAVGREFQGHQGQPWQVVDQVFHRFGGSELHAHAPLGQERLALGHEALQGDDHITRRDLVLVADQGEPILLPAEHPVLQPNELRHRRPP